MCLAGAALCKICDHDSWHGHKMRQKDSICDWSLCSYLHLLYLYVDVVMLKEFSGINSLTFVRINQNYRWFAWLYQSKQRHAPGDVVADVTMQRPPSPRRRVGDRRRITLASRVPHVNNINTWLVNSWCFHWLVQSTQLAVTRRPRTSRTADRLDRALSGFCLFGGGYGGILTY